MLYFPHHKAGLAAYFLGHPSYRPHIWDGTNKQVVAPRIKRLLKLAAWERLPNGDLRTRLGFVGPVGECNNLDEMYDTYPHDVPEWIPMVYNGVHGYQGGKISCSFLPRALEKRAPSQESMEPRLICVAFTLRI